MLDGLINLKSERDRRLFKAYLATFRWSMGRPIFNASGAMGSGRHHTTAHKAPTRPNGTPTVRFDPRDFLQKAMHAYIVMLDNQDTIPEWASDTLCRLVTGEANSKRRLYTDDEDFIIELRRAALLNGINVPTDRGDVLDRSLVVELERIPDGERKTEEQIWELFARDHPGVLGALFDILSKAIVLKPSIKLFRRPRLADWGEYAAAVYEVLGWGAETFLKDWDEVVKVQNQATLDGSPVAQAIIKFMEDKEEYTATSSEMHSKLKVVAVQLGVDVERDKAWPKSARWLWRRIKEVLPLLVAAGIEASRGRDEAAKQITLRNSPQMMAVMAAAVIPAQIKGKLMPTRGDAAIAVLDDFTPLVERISIDEAFADVAGCTHLFGPPAEIAPTIRRRVRAELGLPISIGVARTKHLAKIASQVAKPDGLVVVDPATELAFLHDLPVGLMWGVGPVTEARLAESGVDDDRPAGAGRRAGRWSGCSGRPPGEKLAALAWNRDPRAIGTHRRAHSAGAQSAIGKQAGRGKRVPADAAAPRRPGRHAAEGQVAAGTDGDGARALCRHARGDALDHARPADLGDGDARRNRRGAGARSAGRPSGRADDLAARDLGVASGRARGPCSSTCRWGLPTKAPRPGSRRGLARFVADRAVDKIRDRFGWEAVGYASVALMPASSVPDAFRELAEKEL